MKALHITGAFLAILALQFIGCAFPVKGIKYQKEYMLPSESNFRIGISIAELVSLQSLDPKEQKIDGGILKPEQFAAIPKSLAELLKKHSRIADAIAIERPYENDTVITLPSGFDVYTDFVIPKSSDSFDYVISFAGLEVYHKIVFPSVVPNLCLSIEGRYIVWDESKRLIVAKGRVAVEELEGFVNAFVGNFDSGVRNLLDEVLRIIAEEQLNIVID